MRDGVDAVDGDVEVAVVVVIAEGAAASWSVFHDSRAALVGDFFEAAVAEIAIEIFVLGVFEVGFGFVDFGIDVAVGHEDVEPAVVVHIEEADAPAEEASIDAEAAGISAVFEDGVAEIGVEGIGVAGEIRFYDIEIAVAIVIADGDAHAGLGLGFGGESGAVFDGDVLEGAVVLVEVERGGSGIVGDVNVGPAVVIEIGGGDAEAVGADGVPHAGFLADVGERAVAVVVIEEIFSAGEAGRSAGYDDAFVGAGTFFGERSGFQVEVDVVGDEEIEMAVFVVVDPGAAGVPARFGAGLEEAGAFGDVGEGAVAIVVIENVLAVVGDEEIVVAVVVVVADAAGLSPAGADVEAGTFGDIGEGAVAIIFEEAAMRLFALRETLEAPAVDEEEIEPAVVVVVVEGQAAAGGFEKIFIFADAAENGFDVEAGAFDDIDEADAERRAFDGRFWAGRRRSGLGVVAAFGGADFWFRRGLLLRSGESEKIRKGKNESSAAERAKKFSAILVRQESSLVNAGLGRCQRRLR